jgi:hypothetical protein
VHADKTKEPAHWRPSGNQKEVTSRNLNKKKSEKNTGRNSIFKKMKGNDFRRFFREQITKINFVWTLPIVKVDLVLIRDETASAEYVKSE